MRFCSIFTATILLLFSSDLLAGPTVEIAAREQADDWLKLIDAGEYGEAWAWAAPFFRVQVNREELIGALNKVRSPLGKAESRELVRLFYTTTLPGAPEAHYVIVQYKTKFSGRDEPAIETITPILIDPAGEPVPILEDPTTTPGEWKVSGYFIK